MNEKLNILQNYMKVNNIDLTYLDDPTTVAYYTNFESDPHERIVAYIVLQENHFLFVPSLEREDAIKNSNVENVLSYNDEENPWQIIAQEISRLADNQIHFYCVDEITLTVERDNKLRQALISVHGKDHTIASDDISSFINEMRLIKSDEEIEKMITAGKLADQALNIGINALEVGITEQEVAAIIDMEMKKRGVSEMSFSTLVLFGDHAASPHGVPGERKLVSNEFVLFDLGVIYDGYASDTTRTIAFGEVDDEKRNIYDIVLNAQLATQKAAKPGMKAGELDQIARKIIEDAGYGEYFNHRLGHGIGKTAHEFPSIHGDNDTILEAGMCFSIEPGIYIPGEVGVRIEDCVYMTDKGAEPFTFEPKELRIIE